MKELQSIAEKFANTYGLDPAVFKAQMHHESNWDVRARSKVGAIGVAQIMPSTARSWGVNPHNPISALRAAAKNMAAYVRTYQNQGHDYWTSHKLALAAYNAGSGAVAKHKKVPPYPETQHYVKSILAEARRAE